MNSSNSESVIDKNPSIEQLVEQATAEFQRRFNAQPEWITAAPGRVNLIGEHTDYNDGYVLPMAIQRYTVIAAGPQPAANDARSASRYDVYSTAPDRMESWPVDTQPTVEPAGQWINYVWGVIVECGNRGMQTGGLRAVVHSSVPVGGGLSSSAALEVATATLVESITQQTLAPLDKVRLCQKAEHDYAGVPCGIMDQFTSVMGRKDHLILLDCRAIHSDLVPLASDEVSVLIINSNVKHELTGGEYAERRGQCESAAKEMGVGSLRELNAEQLNSAAPQLEPILLRRARHVVSEIARTVAAADAIKLRDWPQVGSLMVASHASLRDDYEVSCEELDLLVRSAMELGIAEGVYGSRMTGGGFGGCTVSLVHTDQVDSVAEAIATQYQAKTAITPTVFVSTPARGAQVVQRPT